MADKKDFFLTEEQQQKFHDWYTEHVHDSSACPTCAKNEWELLPHMVTMPVFQEGNTYLTPTYPKLMIACKNCGHTQFFNAMFCGLLEEQEKKGEDDVT